MAQVQVAPLTDDENDGIVDKNAIAIGRNEMETLAKLIVTARVALEPLAKATTMTEIGKAMANLGDYDGTGAFLRLGSLDLDQDGSLSEGEYARFMVEADVLINNLQTSANNTSVVTSLLLTIAIDLMFVEMSPPFEGSVEPTPFEPVASGYFSGGDLTSAASLSRSFYAVEVVFMSLMMAACGFGLILSIYVSMLVGSMPGRTAALHFILAHAKLYTWLSTTVTLGLGFVMFSVSFAAARYSVVAFFACLSATCLVLLGCRQVIWQPGKWQMHYFHAQAKRLLKEHETKATATSVEPISIHSPRAWG